jgi:hypothetical protein
MILAVEVVEVFSEVISDNTPQHTTDKKTTAMSGFSFSYLIEINSLEYFLVML